MQPKKVVPTLKERLACWRLFKTVMKGKEEVAEQVRVIEGNISKYRVNVIVSMMVSRVEENKKMFGLAPINAETQKWKEGNQAMELFAWRLYQKYMKDQ
jgi:hypothetical protein